MCSFVKLHVNNNLTTKLKQYSLNVQPLNLKNKNIICTKILKAAFPCVWDSDNWKFDFTLIIHLSKLLIRISVKLFYFRTFFFNFREFQIRENGDACWWEGDIFPASGRSESRARKTGTAKVWNEEGAGRQGLMF